MQLDALGWNENLARTFELYRNRGLVPARVSEEHKERYLLLSEQGELTAEVSGRFMHEAVSRADFPVVGDWVAVSARPSENFAIIHAVLPRTSIVSRKAVLGGAKTDEQALAANIDTLFLVSGLDGDFNIRRIERYLTVAWDSGALPVVVLNKADICEDLDDRLSEVESVTIGTAIMAISAETKEGLDQLLSYLKPGKTAAFLGSSGVGKSTIINGLLGEKRLRTQSVAEYRSKGHHTTTYRQMLILPEGAIVIDTPGMRELGIWTNAEGLERTFGDIEKLAAQCRFSDCQHHAEPGCAVRIALENGSLDADRYKRYLKLQKEMAHIERRLDIARRRRESREWDRKIRSYHKAMKEMRKRGLR